MAKSPSDALFWPIEAGLFDAPPSGGRILCVHVPLAPPGGLAPRESFTMVQPFRPFAAALKASSFRVSPSWPETGGFGHAFVLAAKQAAETRGLLASAALLLEEGGWLVAAGDVDHGGRRLEADMGAIGFEVHALSKYHARIVAGRKTKAFASDRAGAWRDAAMPARCAMTGYVSCPGLFSWDRVDEGSALLAETLPDALSGAGGDFGCGWGYLSRSLGQRGKTPSVLHCVDADARALDACRANLEDLALKTVFHWVDLAAGAPVSGLDWIVMNPPFHEGGRTDPAIGRAFIESAASALRPGGRLFMVANRHLPYEQAVASHFSSSVRRAETGAFKVIHATL